MCWPSEIAAALPLFNCKDETLLGLGLVLPLLREDQDVSSFCAGNKSQKQRHGIRKVVPGLLHRVVGDAMPWPKLATVFRRQNGSAKIAEKQKVQPPPQRCGMDRMDFRARKGDLGVALKALRPPDPHLDP